MKVIFTHAYYISEDFREQEIMKPYVPLGILYLSAYLTKNGFENDVIDTTFSDFEKHVKQLTKAQPKIIGIYTNLMTKLNVLRLIKYIKNEPLLSQTKIVLGGPEVRHHAINFLEHGADFVVIGEGEETMLDLTIAINKNQTDFDYIPGLAFLKNESAFFTPERTNIKNMDDLSIPAREKVDITLYLDAWRKKHGENAISVSTMRGCPYTCKWCSRAVYGQTYRRRSAKLVVEELKIINENYEADAIWFVDDVFTISHKWLNEFNEELKRQNVTVRYECITRADRMNDEVISLLKSSGCYRVWIGAESGSQQVIDAMDRRVDVNQVRQMIIKTRQKGLQAGTFIMVGYPGETEKDLYETLHHLKTSDPDFYTITVAYPIKGTPLYSETESNFIVKPLWSEGTDRMIDFKRNYSRKYYDFAIRWIANEMALHRNLKKSGSRIQSTKHYLKSAAARSGMHFYKLLNF